MTSTDHAPAGSGTLPVVLGGPPRPAVATAPWPGPAGREMELLGRVVQSGTWGFGGPLEAEFERRFAAYQDAEYGLCVANGTVALQLALEALDVGAGDEVIAPGSPGRPPPRQRSTSTRCRSWLTSSRARSASTRPTWSG